MDLPRVTEILSAYTGYDSVPPQILKRAAERGTSVHNLCSSIAKGDWIPESMIAEDLLGYVKSFKMWMEAVDVFILNEKRMTDESLGYTGKLDFVIRSKDGLTYLVDLKTSAKPQKTYPLQMAAYELLLCSQEKINVDAALIVYLDKDGKFPVVEMIDDFGEHRNIFMSALYVWKYFNKGKTDGSIRVRRKKHRKKPVPKDS